jgi:hypothetical protein
MPLIQDNHVVPASRVGNFPPSAQQHRSATDCESRANWLASHVPHSRNYISATLCVSVEQQESVQLFVGQCFSELLHNPKSIGISGHIEVQDLAEVQDRAAGREFIAKS